MYVSFVQWDIEWYLSLCFGLCFLLRGRKTLSYHLRDVVSVCAKDVCVYVCGFESALPPVADDDVATLSARSAR